MIHACGHGRPGRRPRATPPASSPRPARRCAPARRSCATPRWSPPASPAARLPAGQRGGLHAARPAGPGAGRASSAPPAARPRWSCGATGSTAPSSRSATPRPRCSTCWSMIDAGRAAAGRGARHPGRVHRRGRVQGRAGRRSDLEYLVVRGRRGGSAITAAAVNALASEEEILSSAGRLYGVGLGPGDPELVTVKAARLIGAADVVAYHCARHGRSIARRDRRAVPARRPDRGAAGLPGHHRDHRPPGRLPGRDRRVLRRGRRAAGRAPRRRPRRRACSPRATRSSTAPTCTCTSGSPHRYPTEVVPGVTSVSAASAALGRPLVERDEVLTVLPGTLPPRRARARGWPTPTRPRS